MLLIDPCTVQYNTSSSMYEFNLLFRGLQKNTRGHMMNGVQALLYAVGGITTQEVVTHPE